MNTQQLLQASLNGGRAIPRWGWWLSLGAVLVLVPVIYFVGLGGPAPTGTTSSAVTQLEPGAQSVMDYLRVHSSIPDHALSPDPAVQSDPALPSVLNYIHVHESIPDSVILELYRAHADRKD